MTAIADVASKPDDEAFSDLVSRVHQSVAMRLSRMRRPGMSRVSEEALGRKLADEEIDRVNQERLSDGLAVLDSAERFAVVDAVVAMVAGTALLDDYLRDDSIENVDANGPHAVFITRTNGERERGQPLALDRKAFVAYLESLARGGDRSGDLRFGEHRLDRNSPVLQMSIDGHRLTAALGGPDEQGIGRETYLSVRRHRREIKRLVLDDFVAFGTITRHAADFLAAATRAALTTIFAGPANAGKTTLLRAAAHEIASDERLVTIESVPELALQEFADIHPDVVALYTREANSEGIGRISTGELVRTALRLNPSRILIGEVLPGEDVVAWFNALSSGQDGSMSTLHARSSEKVFTRLTAYAAQSPDSPLDPRGSAPLIASALDVIVYLSKQADRRYVSSIRMVAGEAEGRIQSDELFTLNREGVLIATGGVSIPEVASLLADEGYRHRVER